MLVRPVKLACYGFYTVDTGIWKAGVEPADRPKLEYALSKP